MRIHMKCLGNFSFSTADGAIALYLDKDPDSLCYYTLQVQRNQLPERSFTLDELESVHTALGWLISKQQQAEEERSKCQQPKPVTKYPEDPNPA
jgi:hypothetical protein